MLVGQLLRLTKEIVENSLIHNSQIHLIVNGFECIVALTSLKLETLPLNYHLETIFFW